MTVVKSLLTETLAVPPFGAITVIRMTGLPEKTMLLSPDLYDHLKAEIAANHPEPEQTVDDPMCLCNHTFVIHDEQGRCTACACMGFTPENSE